MTGIQEEAAQGPPQQEKSEIPLRRNRAYHLLWMGTTSSEIGLNLSNIAFPLLALAATGSPSVAGAVGAANALAQVVVGVFAGALVDRWDRKKIMVGCLLTRAVALAGLALGVTTGHATVWLMLVAATVAGGASSLFDPAEHASLPLLVPPGQLPTALSVNTARMHMGQLVGTSGGGFLFALGRAVPFLADAVAHLVALIAVSFVKLPKRGPSRTPMSRLHRDIVAGFAFLWRQRFLRTSTLILLGLNFFFQSLFLVVIVTAERGGTPSEQIGVMAAMFGGGGLLGALVAPRVYRLLEPHQAIIAITWILAALVPLMAAVEGVMLWGLLLAGMAFLAPSAYTVIGTRQILVTPDGMRGRLSSVTNLFNGVAQAAGAAVGGALSQWLTGSQAMICCALGLALMAVIASTSRPLRLTGSAVAVADADYRS